MLPGRYRIMVVVSEPGVRMLICSQLRTLGQDTLTCVNDGPAALARLKVESIDLIFLEVGSVLGCGMTALAAIRADPRLRHLPVVVITNRAEQETVEASRALGVSGYLIKPLSEATLATCLRRAFAHDGGTGS